MCVKVYNQRAMAMKCGHLLTKIGLGLVIIVFCLQNHVTFTEESDTLNAFTVAIEFRHTRQSHGGASVINPIKDTGYSLLSKEKDIYAYQAKDQFWVADASEILAVQNDLSHTFIDQAMGLWTINIVFQPDFSRRLIEVNKQHAGEEMAIMINGHLVTVPCLSDHPEHSLNADGQFLLAIPTRFSSYEAIDQFMQKFNL
jgi:hypothetical protein